MKDTESILTAILQKEIKRLKIINTELLEACKAVLSDHLFMINPLVYKQIENTITKAERKE